MYLIICRKNFLNLVRLTYDFDFVKVDAIFYLKILFLYFGKEDYYYDH